MIGLDDNDLYEDRERLVVLLELEARVDGPEFPHDAHEQAADVVHRALYKTLTRLNHPTTAPAFVTARDCDLALERAQSIVEEALEGR